MFRVSCNAGGASVDTLAGMVFAVMGKNRSMRLRFGLFTGFAIGYYLGAMAGRDRYHQLNRLIKRAKRSDAVGSATSKAKAVADVAADRAKDGATAAKDAAIDKMHHTKSSTNGSTTRA